MSKHRATERLGGAFLLDDDKIIDTKLNTAQKTRVPQTVLHFLGIVHGRATEPKEPQIQASGPAQDLKDAKDRQIQSDTGNNNDHFLMYCTELWLSP